MILVHLQLHSVVFVLLDVMLRFYEFMHLIMIRICGGWSRTVRSYAQPNTLHNLHLKETTTSEKNRIFSVLHG